MPLLENGNECRVKAVLSQENDVQVCHPALTPLRPLRLCAFAFNEHSSVVKRFGVDGHAAEAGDVAAEAGLGIFGDAMRRFDGSLRR